MLLCFLWRRVESPTARSSGALKGLMDLKQLKREWKCVKPPLPPPACRQCFILEGPLWTIPQEGKACTGRDVSSTSPLQSEGASGFSHQLFCLVLCRLAAVPRLCHPLSPSVAGGSLGCRWQLQGRCKEPKSSEEKHQCSLQS